MGLAARVLMSIKEKQMSSIRYSTQYKKDIKNISINEVNLVNELIKKLVNKECLEPKYKDHALIGDYKDFRECHVKANLLLIYRHFGDKPQVK